MEKNPEQQQKRKIQVYTKSYIHLVSLPYFRNFYFQVQVLWSDFSELKKEQSKNTMWLKEKKRVEGRETSRGRQSWRTRWQTQRPREPQHPSEAETLRLLLTPQHKRTWPLHPDQALVTPAMRCAASGGHASEWQGGRWTTLSWHLVLLAVLHGTKSWGDPERLLILLLNEYFNVPMIYQELPMPVLQAEGKMSQLSFATHLCPWTPARLATQGSRAGWTWVHRAENVLPQPPPCLALDLSFSRRTQWRQGYFLWEYPESRPLYQGSLFSCFVMHTILLYHTKNEVHFRGHLCLLVPWKVDIPCQSDEQYSRIPAQWPSRADSR